MTADDGGRSAERPSPWFFPALAAGAFLIPLITMGLDNPMSQRANTLLVVAAAAFPAASLFHLLGQSTVRDKVAVLLTFIFGGASLLWVDWTAIDGHIAVVALALFLVPALVSIIVRR